MSTNTNTNTNTNTLQNFQIVVDGQLQSPTITERLQSHIEARISRVKGSLVLQARMATFDALHGTNYRQVRNKLARERRNREFEKSIGICPVNK